ncbi:MAG: PAS domain-containing protein [Alphaproteobacteria bacterium]|nr:PAS domain-containing protein [Alphaproteobacteria bacterium]
MKIPTAEAFRSQLVIAEQRQLYDYWLDKSDGNFMPSRKDICPSHFPRLLPFISLVERDTEAGRFKIRLSGTRLREIYEREVTGCYVEELGCVDRPDYWSVTYDQIANSARPAQGAVRGPSGTKDHLVQFWIRLPLGNDQGEVEMILAYDRFVPAVEMSELQTNCA